MYSFLWKIRCSISLTKECTLQKIYFTRDTIASLDCSVYITITVVHLLVMPLLHQGELSDVTVSEVSGGNSNTKRYTRSIIIYYDVHTFGSDSKNTPSVQFRNDERYHFLVTTIESAEVPPKWGLSKMERVCLFRR